MTIVKKTAWNGVYEINTEAADIEGKVYVHVHFPTRNTHKRTKRLYTPEQADTLMKSIVVHTKEHDFPWTDHHGNRMWIDFDPTITLPY